MDDAFTTAMDRARDLVRAGKPAEATQLIRAALARQSALDPTVDPLAEPPRKPAARSAPPGRLTQARIDTEHGSHGYRLHLPPAAPKGLVLMLHGCTQTPADFVAATRIEPRAAALGLAVATPAQTRSENAQGCWNWFRPGDQRRGQGEPALLAALVRQLAAALHLPPDQLFVAGLSAGGAMAAILGREYPDLFGAIAVHSGLPAGAADDAMSAFAAMRGDPPPPVSPRASARSTATVVALRPRLITFHGSADATVNPINSARLMAAMRGAGAQPVRTERRINGRDTVCTRTLAPDGRVLTEDWRIIGAGHAWSGGAAGASHADTMGPDATALMLAFFLGLPESI